ncbi:MAG: hypothetical protein GWM90_06415, partial [Gemmatimonadetes bacterium]|nr:hypothetical protein [Gemmatimonadota bacterium]NIQ53412.1 hypothetical protein [Gemmatimonadota bacterium]NIU73558.1 hypothetical protein [Gammaproteobacteria bacterium]NIX43756.1 hypothetical protein [Gemmatimonadota bacterium]NIY07952.1 hypothetical protein [Gemmatimonadota bacterium]
MRRVTLSLSAILCGLLIGACAEQEGTDEMEAADEQMTEAPAAAEAPTVSLEQFAGTWDATTYLESGDTVDYTMTATADTTGWMI